MENNNSQIAVHEQRISSLEARMKNAEHMNDTIHELALSVKELTVNQTQMLKEQRDQGQRIRVLEEEPAKNAKQLRMRIIECAVTTIVGAIIGVLIGFLAR